MRVLRGATAIAGQLDTFHRAANATLSHPVLVNGHPGLLNTINATPISLLAFTITNNKITAIDLLSDPTRLPRTTP
ncbi:hypothetical protein [Nocardia sp. CA-119907]|uniref:hypothetical protein n=1 Tax=Nocardia sp. CA-119907 TaxID=3239973 RepID=UPI003D996330